MKKTKRSQDSHPNLNPKLNSRIRQEYLDYDYLDKLGAEERAWLNQFSGEYYNASLVLDNENELDPKQNLHKDPKYKKELYDANNARNRCQYGLVKNRVALTKLVNYDDLINVVEEQLAVDNGGQSVEIAYTDYIDSLEVKVMLREYETSMKTFRESCE
jgi:septum formation topological specificity factor MinE